MFLTKIALLLDKKTQFGLFFTEVCVGRRYRGVRVKCDLLKILLYIGIFKKGKKTI